VPKGTYYGRKLSLS